MDPQEILDKLVAADAAGDEEAARALKELYDQAIAAQGQTAAPEIEDRGAGEAIRHGLQQGATFGFADEASAAARALLDPLFDRMTGATDEVGAGDQSFMDRYRMYRDDERSQIAAGREHHGGKMFTAELLPGLVAGGAGLLGRGAQAGGRAALDQMAKRTLGQNVGRGAAVGSGYGALAGVGYGEGEGLGGMASDALTGAAFGAGVGGGLPLVGSAIKRGYQGIAGRVGAESGADTATRRAQNELMIAMEKDRLTPDELLRRFADDPDAFLMDMGGNVGQLAKLTARMPGEGGRRIVENVIARQRKAPERIRPGMRNFIQRAFRDEDAMLPENFAKHERQIMERGRRMADEQGLWDNAYLPTYRAPRSMLNFLRTRDGRILNKDARAADKIARDNLQRRVTMGEIAPDDPGMLARYHEEVLRALKSKIKIASSPIAAKPRTAETTSLMLRQHRKLLDDFGEAMPEDWHEARRLWAGTQANREAYELGGKVLSAESDAVRLNFERMSQSEVDNYLVGALRAIEHNLARKGDTTDILRALRDTAHGRELMRMLAGDEKTFHQFMRQALREQEKLATFRRVTGGSDTFENIMGAAGTAKGETLGGEVGTILGIGMQQNSRLARGVAGIPLIGRALGRRIGGAIASRDEQFRDQLSDMLLSRDPSQLNQMMQRPPMPSATPAAIGGLGLSTQLPGLLED